MGDMITTFEKFSKNSLIITNADDENCRPIFNNKTITFGINKTADFMAKRITKNNIGYSFTCYAYGQRLGRINLKIMGKHNVYNALSAMAVANYYKIPFEYQKQALEGFLGVDRRNEYLGKIFNLYAYADYAHHPKELSATINAFNEKEEKYITVFQPHTYSRTKFLMNDFISVLINQQNLIIFYIVQYSNVPLIEGEQFGNPEIEQAVAEYAAPLKEAGIDALILSCTHYPFIKDVVEAEFGSEVTVIDPAEATAKLSKEALEKEGLLSDGEGSVTICCPADLERVKRLASRMLPLEQCQFKEITLIP